MACGVWCVAVYAGQVRDIAPWEPLHLEDQERQQGRRRRVQVWSGGRPDTVQSQHRRWTATEWIAVWVWSLILNWCWICSVLQPSSIRGLATPWTYFLHLSPSSAILIDSSAGSPVHVLMFSFRAVRGLPRLRAPGIVPCIISFSRQLPCFLMVWP